MIAQPKTHTHFYASKYQFFSTYDIYNKHGPHVKKIQERMMKQTCALTKVTASTWGATFARARQVYSAVVRPAMTYVSAMWYSPTGTKGAKQGTVDKIEVIQNKCLRAIAGAYRATPIEVLQAETLIPPMKEHLINCRSILGLVLRLAAKQLLYESSVKKLKQNCAAVTAELSVH